MRQQNSVRISVADTGSTKNMTDRMVDPEAGVLVGDS